MTEKANADDFQVRDFLKKKKRKHKKYKKYENDESIHNVELSCAPPLLLEDQAAQSGEGCKKKKKSQNKGEKQESSLDNSCVGLEHGISNETGVDASQKKKKKKKRKYNDNADEQTDVTCVTVNQHSTDACQEFDADYIYLKQSVKKKRKDKLPEEDEVHELPTSETCNKNDNKSSKKKKKKKRGSSTQDMQEDTDVTIGQSLLSSPEQNRQGEDTVLPLPAEEGGVAAPHQWHKDGDCNAASAMSEDSVDLPANFSKLTKAADESPRKTPGRARKAKKSSAFVVEESSSESDVMTPEPSASNREKDQSSSFSEMAATDEPSLDEEEWLDSTTCSVMDLDTAKQELEQFIPHVRNISDDSIRKMAGRDLMRFKQFKKQGIAVKFGRFSEKENNQIRKNVEEFLLITGIDSAEKLLFTSRYPEDKETINRLKAEHHFCEKLSEGIPRPWRLIYYRARKMFDPNNYKGRYTKDEKEKLKKYHALHGNDWKKISEMMSRSNLSVAMKYSEIKSAINYGPWSKEETQKLMRAVEEVIRKRMEIEDRNSLSSLEKSHREIVMDCERLYQKLPWTEIEAKVGTRYWRQCKQKWTTILTKKMTKGQQLYRGTKRLQTKINLIKRDVPRAYVQAKFYKLKVSCVPSWQKKTFSEIVDYLFENKLPELEEKLEKGKGKDLSSESSTTSQQKKAFQLSDIFDSSEESD
ncbi:transcription termination factor 1 isoform 2-T3 [Morus bassanus]